MKVCWLVICTNVISFRTITTEIFESELNSFMAVFPRVSVDCSFYAKKDL